tara:strand:- start:3073 stop:3552 length:480 start_codon:yes stop_codon:yes gene_type:complete
VKRFSFILITLFILIFSCQDGDAIYSSHVETKGAWLKNEPIKASLEVYESPVDIYLILKLNEDYPFSNIYLLSSISNTDLKITDTIYFKFDYSKNKSLLSRQMRIKTFKIPIYKNMNINEKTSFEISHAVRFIDSIEPVMKLEGILDIGILVNKSNEEI